MPADAAFQLLVLAAEAIAVCGLLLWFFHLRTIFGFSLLYITLGAFQHLQTLMAATLYIEIAPGIVVSPGSTILFTATLFAVLLVYIRDDAVQTRSLIVGIVAANLTLSLVVYLATWHLNSELLIATGFSSEHLLTWNIKAFAVGTATLIVDVILIIVLYEFFFHLFPRLLFARIAAAMLIVVAVDTLLFVTATFYGETDYVLFLTSGLIGKSAVAIVYSALLTSYLIVSRRRQRDAQSLHEPVHDVFHILTYKQRYERLEEEVKRDALSGLYNRGFFDDNLRRELERAKHLQHSLNVVLIDLDHFKAINDTYGHQVGDETIVTLARSMETAFRAADILCRYGGEEFVVVMPDSSIEAAYKATSRLQKIFKTMCSERELRCGSDITFTAGIANYPADASTEAELIAVADRRLYKGKNEGRNRVMFDTQIMRKITKD